MGLTDRLSRLGASAPLPVLLAAGGRGDALLEPLRLDERIRTVGAPRAATVVVGAGALPDDLLPQLLRLHDALPHPRAVAWLVTHDDPAVPAIPGLATLEPPHTDRLVGLGRDLRTGLRASDPPLLPDEDPAPWRGVGPYGQGGSGMTGGVPYGRPMASLAPDRDGLRLDRLPVTIGPWFPYLPAGLRLRVGFAGDVVSGVEVLSPAAVTLRQPAEHAFDRVLGAPVPIRDLELSRARSHLRALAMAIEGAGLVALARRARRLAAASTIDPLGLARFERSLEWSGFLRWTTGSVGRLRAEDADLAGLGPVGRASGVADDVRAEMVAYEKLGFRQVTQQSGDARARWLIRLAEMRQSLALAASAGDLTVGPMEAFEGPRGRLTTDSRPTDRVLPLLAVLLDGREWGDALTTLLSLDLGPEAYIAGSEQPALAS